MGGVMCMTAFLMLLMLVGLAVAFEAGMGFLAERIRRFRVSDALGRRRDRQRGGGGVFGRDAQGAPCVLLSGLDGAGDMTEGCEDGGPLLAVRLYRGEVYVGRVWIAPYRSLPRVVWVNSRVFVLTAADVQGEPVYVEDSALLLDGDRVEWGKGS